MFGVLEFSQPISLHFVIIAFVLWSGLMSPYFLPLGCEGTIVCIFRLASSIYQFLYRIFFSPFLSFAISLHSNSSNGVSHPIIPIVSLHSSRAVWRTNNRDNYVPSNTQLELIRLLPIWLKAVCLVSEVKNPPPPPTLPETGSSILVSQLLPSESLQTEFPDLCTFWLTNVGFWFWSFLRIRNAACSDKKIVIRTYFWGSWLLIGMHV